MTTVNDIVLIHMENQPVGFARIEAIDPDHKRDWFHVKLLILTVPLQVATWILKNDYINGGEFTMHGKKMRLDRVVCPDQEEPAESPPPETQALEEKKSGPKGSKIISLSRRKDS